MLQKISLLTFLLFSTHTLAFFYPESYLESRSHFKQIQEKLIEKGFTDLASISLKVPSDKNKDLTIDGFYIPQKGEVKERLMIVTSGIHGVEAFTGAAIQFEFIERYLKPELLESTGLLIIHSVNPYGFHFHRRVDEDNVDLNRNFSATDDHFQTKLKGYAKFENFVNPQGPAKAGKFSDLFLFAKSLWKLVVYGRQQIAQIAVGGQYQNPKGIYFGGDQTQTNAVLIFQVFNSFGKDYSKILHIDLHTGYGERGKLHFFSSKKVMALPGFDLIFKGFDIDAGSDDNFYETSGSFDQFTLMTFPNKDVVIPMTFEFGTMDSQTILGGFYSLRNLIRENQGFQYGYKSDDAEKKIKKDFMEMFNPSDKAWREKVVNSGSSTLNTVLDRFSKL